MDQNELPSKTDDEPLLDGFSLLRLVQSFLNPDINYIGLVGRETQPEKTECRKCLASRRGSLFGQAGGEGKEVESYEDGPTKSRDQNQSFDKVLDRTEIVSVQIGHKGSTDIALQKCPHINSRKPNLYEELTDLVTLKRFVNPSSYLGSIIKLAQICLSLMAIMVSIDKTLSTVLLCIFSRSDIKRKSMLEGQPSMPYEASDVSMSWFVLVLVNLSSTYILISTIFNGHLLWNLLDQRLFLVSRHFQYKTMLSLIIFAYLEYIINISFINHLFGWSFEGEDLEGNGKVEKKGNLHESYSILSRLEIFVTDQNQENSIMDILLTVLQFSRGVIRISPYITINYVIICLNEHIRAIRNQVLLTESLKKKQKLRLVVKSSRAANLSVRSNNRLAVAQPNGNRKLSFGTIASPGGQFYGNRAKKRVIFATQTSGANIETVGNGSALDEALNQVSKQNFGHTDGNSLTRNGVTSIRENNSVNSIFIPCKNSQMTDANKNEDKRANEARYSNRIRDFYELESYITNLYIFTGRLNRLMSRQGLAMFFIVHNLIITCSLIVPEAIKGGPPMVQFIRLLVIIIGIVPFRCGQSFNGQLKQLSKQIDRIIIQQQFFGRRRDNLIRIRELLHDIRIDCAGMLNFNIETGLKYLVIAFASAFFIEQEGK